MYKDYGFKAQRLVDLFSKYWGSHKQDSFVYEPLTLDEANRVLASVDWLEREYLVFSSFGHVLDIFRARVQMEDFSDYRLGYVSEIFKSLVISVLNTPVVAKEVA